ncbi:MAG: mandelate racemase/muconate lactonizing enzyme family protein, partial [Hyphomicrobiaceae bacterium]
MKISRITIWGHPLKLKQPFGLSGGRIVTALETTIVRVEANNGVTGWGESCPWGSDYLPAFPEAVRAGLTVLAPDLIGRDPANLSDINAFVNQRLHNQPSVLTAIDMACVDLAARKANMPACQFLGGRRGETVPLPGGIGQTPGPEMEKRMADWRARGVKQMSAKASGNVDENVALVQFVLERLEPGEFMKLDANGGWRLDDAMRIADVMDGRVWVEQPCGSYAECLTFARRSGRAIYLDEIVTGAEDILRAHADGILAGVNLKVARFGGLTRTRLMRDLMTELGLPFFIQDAGGSALARAAIVHLATGAPPRLLNGVWDCATILT